MWPFVTAIAVWLLAGCGTGNVDPVVDACGDAEVDPGEECDDGNDAAGDGCDPSCALEGPDLPCFGEPIPETADNPIVLDGRNFDAATQESPGPDVEMEAFSPDGGVLATALGDDEGGWAISIPTGGAPFLGSLRASRADYVPVRLHYGYPIVEDIAVPAAGLISADGLDGFYFGVGLTRDPERSLLQIVPIACDRYPLPGVTVTVDPPAERLVYITPDGSIDVHATETTVDLFAAMAFNLPAGDVTVTLDYHGTPLTTRILRTHAGEISVLWPKP